MAKLIYSQFKSQATDMLRLLGAAATITSRENGTLKGYAVFIDSSTKSNPDDSNTKTVYFQGSDKDPKPAPNDILSFKGSNWGVMSVSDINPDGALTILFKLAVLK